MRYFAFLIFSCIKCCKSSAHRRLAARLSLGWAHQHQSLFKHSVASSCCYSVGQSRLGKVLESKPGDLKLVVLPMTNPVTLDNSLILSLDFGFLLMWGGQESVWTERVLIAPTVITGKKRGWKWAALNSFSFQYTSGVFFFFFWVNKNEGKQRFEKKSLG